MPKIHDPIYGYIPLEEYEAAIIDCLLLQRLRGIHQQGTAYLTYPSSTHNRFTHSLGVMKLCSDAIDSLRRKHPTAYDTQTYVSLRALMRIVSLWHDCGHGPFSHASERIFQQNMSDSQKKEMKDAGTQDDKMNPHEYFAYKLLNEYLPKYLDVSRPSILDFLEDIKETKIDIDLFLKFINQNADSVLHRTKTMFYYSSGPGTPDRPLWYQKGMKQLLNSDFDVDRMDFVQRDSYVSGTKMGHLDIQGLLDNLELYSEAEGLVFARPAWSSIETLILERYKLYRWLNFHHVVCFTDEVMSRIMELGIYCNLFDKEEFSLDFFKSLADRDLEYLEYQKTGKKPAIYASGLLDDDYILNKVRQNINVGKTKEEKLLRHYLSLIESRMIYRSIWKVMDPLNEDVQSITLRLERALNSDRDERKTFFNGVVIKLEEEIASKLRFNSDDILIAFKPYSPIPSDLNVNIIVDDVTHEIRNISNVSGFISLLHKGRRSSYEIRNEIVDTILNILRKKSPQSLKKISKDELQIALSGIIGDTPQLYTRAYIYIRGLNDREVITKREEVINILKNSELLK